MKQHFGSVLTKLRDIYAVFVEAPKDGSKTGSPTLRIALDTLYNRGVDAITALTKNRIILVNLEKCEEADLAINKIIYDHNREMRTVSEGVSIHSASSSYFSGGFHNFIFQVHRCIDPELFNIPIPIPQKPEIIDERLIDLLQRKYAKYIATKHIKYVPILAEIQNFKDHLLITRAQNINLVQIKTYAECASYYSAAQSKAIEHDRKIQSILMQLKDILNVDFFPQFREYQLDHSLTMSDTFNFHSLKLAAATVAKQARDAVQIIDAIVARCATDGCRFAARYGCVIEIRYKYAQLRQDIRPLETMAEKPIPKHTLLAEVNHLELDGRDFIESATKCFLEYQYSSYLY